jgi:hypothetical protein
MTASVARLVAAKLRSEAKPLRLGYFADCYRYDNPQMGRYREFRQAGFELLGSVRPEADAEILLVACDLLKRLGLRFTVKVGHEKIGGLPWTEIDFVEDVKKALECLGYAVTKFPSEGAIFAPCEVGGCYNCAVYVNGSVQPSCITPVHEGMEIVTELPASSSPLRCVHGWMGHGVARRRGRRNTVVPEGSWAVH